MAEGVKGVNKVQIARQAGKAQETDASQKEAKAKEQLNAKLAAAILGKNKNELKELQHEDLTISQKAAVSKELEELENSDKNTLSTKPGGNLHLLS